MVSVARSLPFVAAASSILPICFLMAKRRGRNEVQSWLRIFFEVLLLLLGSDFRFLADPAEADPPNMDAALALCTSGDRSSRPTTTPSPRISAGGIRISSKSDFAAWKISAAFPVGRESAYIRVRTSQGPWPIHVDSRDAASSIVVFHTFSPTRFPPFSYPVRLSRLLTCAASLFSISHASAFEAVRTPHDVCALRDLRTGRGSHLRLSFPEANSCSCFPAALPMTR